MNKVLDGGGGEARLQTVRAQGPRRGDRTLWEYCREGEGLTCVVGARVDDKIQEGARTWCMMDAMAGCAAMTAVAAVAITAAATPAAMATMVEAATCDNVPMATGGLGRHSNRQSGGLFCLRSSTVRFSRRTIDFLVTGRLIAWQECV